MALVRINDETVVETKGIVSITQNTATEVLIRYQKGEHVRLRNTTVSEVLTKVAPNKLQIFRRR